MLVLGVESSCDETGVALYDSAHGLLAHALHSQIAMHNDYGGVVPELASRDHIRRVLPLTRQVLSESGRTLADLDGIAYTQGPGLAGALLVGAGMARSLAFALHPGGRGAPPRGHMLSPLISDAPPEFRSSCCWYRAGTQLMLVSGVSRHPPGRRRRRRANSTNGSAAGLGYPGGPPVESGGNRDASRSRAR
jgi:N6-L-threonylcarbamoyladenine synthase